MNPRVFDEFRDIVYAESGIRLQDGRETMLSARLAGRIRALSLASEEAYLDFLKKDLCRESVQLLDAISTNVTHFFREAEHFEIFSDHVRGLLDAGQSKIRVWCAASSTGEEPYTLAMALDGVINKRRGAVDARILATDISTRVLKIAKAGVYTRQSVDTVPEDLRRKYFDVQTEADDQSFAVKPSLKSMLLFKRLNLSSTPFPMSGPMDVIFCRNVMIYFDDPVREALVGEFMRLLRPGGCLVVGQSESLLRWGHLVEPVGPSVYRKKDGRS